MGQANDIEAKAFGELDSFKYSRGKSRAHDSVKQLTEQTSHEYGNRFLIELVQNAHDAHPRERTDGQILIRFNRDEGEFGTLYVANGGNPFSHDNFLAVCDIGLSSKEPGEAIGNKGLGFRSVLQISRWPEVYSASVGVPISTSFGGYCFGFARPDDIRALCREHFPDDADLVQEALEHLSPYSVPIHQANQTHEVAAFARAGFASVVRLPLSGASAVQAVEQEFAALRASDVPLLLFLDRLSRLNVEIVSGGMDVETWGMNRTQEDGPVSASGCGSSVVRLGDDGEFLVFSADLDRERLLAALQESVDADKLPKSWLKWRDDAKISVAVRLDDEIEQTRLYNFLPMGPEAACPFHGYLNAPFYTKTDRTNLHIDVPLNSYLLDEAAGLCARATLSLRTLTEAAIGSARADLLTWGTDVARLEASFMKVERDVRTLDLLPILPRSPQGLRGSLADAYRWDDDGLSIMTGDRLSKQTDAILLDPELGQTRVARIDQLCRRLFDTGLDPGFSDIADWAQSIAKQLLRKKRFQPRDWDRFYADLAKIFESNADALMTKTILIGEDGRLYEADAETAMRRRRRIVFFPPRNTRTEGEEEVDAAVDVRVPALLRKGVVFMHPDLTWYEGRAPRRTVARAFMENRRLVHRYSTLDLRDHVASLLSRSKSERVHMDALRWLYQLDRATKADLRLVELPVHVPTIGGICPASEAHFSSAWQTGQSDELGRLIADARGASADINALDQRLLLAPQAWPFTIEDVGSWARFLQAVGVRDGLWPTAPTKLGSETEGFTLQGERLRSVSGLDARDADRWTAAVRETGRVPAYPYTPYAFRSRLFRIAGQSDAETWSPSARQSFAKLILRGLDAWSDDALTCSVWRPNHQSRPDFISWPTPLAAFLKSSPWLPVRWPGVPGVEFVRPSDAWVAFASDEEPAPRYGPILPVEFSRMLEQPATARTRMLELGLKVWGRPEDDGELVLHLGRLLHDQRVPESQSDAFRKTYFNAWIRLLENPLRFSTVLPPDGFLVVSRNHALSVVAVGASEQAEVREELVVVDDHQDELLTQLTRALGFATFEIDAEHSAAAIAELTAALGDRVRSMDDLRVQVIVDGSPFSPSESDARMVDGEGDWLGLFVSLALEFHASFSSLRSQATRNEMLRRLRKIKIRRVVDIEVEVEGASVVLPSFLRDAIAVDDDEAPTIVIKGGSRGEDDAPAPADLGRLVRPMAQLIRRPELGDALELAAIKLSDVRTNVELGAPTDEEYALAFSVGADAVRGIRRTLRGSVSAALELLYPVMVYFVGGDAGEQFAPSDDRLPTDDAIIAELRKFEQDLPMTGRELLNLCNACDSLEQLRDKLALEYERFNSVLETLGLRPFENRDGQHQEFRYFKATHREEVYGVLRACWQANYQAGRALTQYVRAGQEFEALAPAEHWLRVCHLPTSDMMSDHLNDWLSTLGASRFEDWDRKLPPIDELREKNGALVRLLVPTVRDLVQVWTRKNDIALDDIWSDGAAPASDLAERLHETGRLDFSLLDELRLLADLRMLGLWPAGMPLSASLDDLSIDQSELTALKERSSEERRQRQIARESIEVNGQAYQASPDHFASIAEAVRSSLTPEFLASSRDLANLDEITESAQSRGSGGGAVEARRLPRLTEPQRDAVGLVGEVAAFEWLKHHFPDSMSDACWKSAYRQHVVGGPPGDDSLGYDFELERRSFTTYWEVKASIANAMEIELTAKEVEVAQRCAGDGRRRYRIVYVPYALDPTRQSIHVLPNPFSDRGRALFRAGRSGLKYAFRLMV